MYQYGVSTKTLTRDIVSPICTPEIIARLDPFKYDTVVQINTRVMTSFSGKGLNVLPMILLWLECSKNTIS